MLHGKRKFDASADFSVSRGFTIAGIDLERGQPFDKTLVRSDRVLEQLFNQRKIEMGEGFGGIIPSPVEPTVQPPEDDEETRLRAEYHILTGRKAPSNIKIETLRARVNG